MNTIDTFRGRAALIIVTSAAMIEYGGLPLWVGVLIGHHGFDPRQAGALVSVYLAGAVVSGFLAAPIFGRLKTGKLIAIIGLSVGAFSFFALSKSTHYSYMLVLHALGGLSIGPVLAVSQGSIGRSVNPHRLFAMTAVVSSLCAASFLAIMPTVVDKHGGSLFFLVVAFVFIMGVLAALIGFPSSEVSFKKTGGSAIANTTDNSANKIPSNAWFVLLGLVCMAIIFSMTMSFVERVGTDRNYGLAAISTVLTMMAITKLFPAAVAGLLEKKLTIKQVLLTAPVIQAIACAAIFAIPNFIVYSIAAPIFITTLLFAQVFAFGLISRLEPTGKATALSPSIVMMGSMIGPFLGGAIIKAFGYPALAIVGFVLASIGIFFFSKVINIIKIENAEV